MMLPSGTNQLAIPQSPPPNNNIPFNHTSAKSASWGTVVIVVFEMWAGLRAVALFYVTFVTLTKACSVDLPLDAVFVIGHKKSGSESTYASQIRWVTDSANYLGIGVLDRDTQIGLVSDENDGKELTCITTDIDVLKWQLNKQAVATANSNATALAIQMAGTLLPVESRTSADHVRNN